MVATHVCCLNIFEVSQLCVRICVFLQPDCACTESGPAVPWELDAEHLTSSGRTSVAAGFALLQLARGTIKVAPEDLSYAPEWVVKAYQMLKVLLPLNHAAARPEMLDHMIYNFYQVGHVLTPLTPVQRQSPPASRTCCLLAC